MLLSCSPRADLARLFTRQVSLETPHAPAPSRRPIHPTSFQAGAAVQRDTNRVMCAVLTESDGSLLTVAPSDVSLTCTPSPCAEALGNVVTVRVTGQFALLTPFLALFIGGARRST